MRAAPPVEVPVRAQPVLRGLRIGVGVALPAYLAAWLLALHRDGDLAVLPMAAWAVAAGLLLSLAWAGTAAWRIGIRQGGGKRSCIGRSQGHPERPSSGARGAQPSSASDIPLNAAESPALPASPGLLQPQEQPAGGIARLRWDGQRWWWCEAPLQRLDVCLWLGDWLVLRGKAESSSAGVGGRRAWWLLLHLADVPADAHALRVALCAHAGQNARASQGLPACSPTWEARR